MGLAGSFMACKHALEICFTNFSLCVKVGAVVLGGVSNRASVGGKFFWENLAKGVGRERSKEVGICCGPGRLSSSIFPSLFSLFAV